MNLEIELEHNHLTCPERITSDDPEKEYYWGIIYDLEYRAYDTLMSRKRNNSGNIGNTKANRWKQSSAEFFNSLAKQARDWLEGNSSFPNPWSFKQWHKIRSIFKDTSLMPYQDKIDREKDNLMMDELRRKADAYDALTNGIQSLFPFLMMISTIAICSQYQH